MNRGTVIFLTLVVLLTHTLAIYQTPYGEFAAPYDSAHVAYRIGRNLVYTGVAQWDPGGAPADSYPSLMWIGLSAVASRLNFSPTVFSQYVGLASALATIVLLAQFSTKRIAGLIAPLLLASSGSAAAAAANGTETSLVMFLVTAAFLAFERGWLKPTVALLCMLSVSASEGILFVLALGTLELVDRPGDRLRRASIRGAFVFMAVGLVLVLLLRNWLTGSPLLPFEKQLLSFDSEQIVIGGHYIWSFVFASGLGLLLPLPALALLTGHLSPSGRRAAVLFLAWALSCLLTGGDQLPFWNVLAPVLPLLFLSIQDAMTNWMDAKPRLIPPCWSGLIATVAACFLVSKLPGDLGPIPMENLLRKWMKPSPVLETAYEHPLGRAGLLKEIRKVSNLRPIGVFLRDKVREDTSIVTFWPGAIGYLSRKDVIDALGRTSPPPGESGTRSWRGLPRVDLIAGMRGDGDYIVPLVGSLAENSTPTDFLRTWLRRWDMMGDTEDRLHDLIAALGHYELIAVPVAARDHQPDIPSPYPFFLLRNRNLKLGPRLALDFDDDGSFSVEIKHEGHRQVVDLYVVAADRDGNLWSMRPTGEWVQAASIAARTSLLLHKTGSRTIHALQGELRENTVVLSASLHNPSLPPGEPFSGIGIPAHERVPSDR